MPASALDKSLGTKTENAASATMTLTTSAAAVSNSRIYVAIMWAGAATLSSFAGGSLTWVIDAQAQSGGFNVAIVSANAPAGLASATVLTATFSASCTHGLIAAGSFVNVNNSATPDSFMVTTNTTGVATARWGPLQAMGANDEGGLVFLAACVDSTGTSNPIGDATELHDLTDAAFFGILTTQYKILGPNQLGMGNGDYSTVAGSVSNNGAAVYRRDTAGVVTTKPVGRLEAAKMRAY